jgi:hypothetical protein
VRIALLLLFTALLGASAVAVAADPGSAPAEVRLTYATGTARSPVAVWVAKADGREPRRLGRGDEPLLSPDGQSVAASLFGAGSSPEQGPALAIYPTIGNQAANYLSLATATAMPLAWSSDSRYVAVSLQSTSVTKTAQRSGLAVIDARTGAVTTIAHGQIYGASFAPDSSDMLAYALSRSLSPLARVDVYVSRPDGSGLRALTRDGRSLEPVWGPRYIAYDRERLRRNDAPVFQIWLKSPSGAGGRRLTNVRVPSLLSGLVPIAFSSDGSRLLAEFEGQDTSEAWTVRVISGRARKLSVRGRPVMAGGISRDGRTVLIDEGALEGPQSSDRVATIPFAGGRSQVLVAHGSQAGWNG